MSLNKDVVKNALKDVYIWSSNVNIQLVCITQYLDLISHLFFC